MTCFFVVGRGNWEIASIFASTGLTLPCPTTCPKYVTQPQPNSLFSKFDSQLRFAQTLEELSHNLDVFLPRSTINDDVVDVSFATFDIRDNTVNESLERRW